MYGIQDNTDDNDVYQIESIEIYLHRGKIQ